MKKKINILGQSVQTLWHQWDLINYINAIEENDEDKQINALENLDFHKKWPIAEFAVTTFNLAPYDEKKKEEDPYDVTSNFWFEEVEETIDLKDVSPLVIAAYYENIPAIRLVLKRFKNDEQKQLISRTFNSLLGESTCLNALFTLLSAIPSNFRLSNDDTKKLEAKLVQKLDVIRNLDELIEFCTAIMANPMIYEHKYYSRYPYNKIQLIYYMQKKAYQLTTSIEDQDTKKIVCDKIIATGLFDESHLNSGVIRTFHDLFTTGTNNTFQEVSISKLQDLIAYCHREDLLRYNLAVEEKNYDAQKECIKNIGFLTKWPDFKVSNCKVISNYTPLTAAAFFQDSKAINILLTTYKFPHEFPLLVSKSCNMNFENSIDSLETTLFMFNCLQRICPKENFDNIAWDVDFNKIEKYIMTKLENVKSLEDLINVYERHIKNGIIQLHKPIKPYFLGAKTYPEHKIWLIEGFQKMANQFLDEIENFDEKNTYIEKIDNAGIFSEAHSKFGVPQKQFSDFNKHKEACISKLLDSHL